MRRLCLPIVAVAFSAMSSNTLATEAQDTGSNARHEISGVVESIASSRLTLRTRTGMEAKVDISAAIAAGLAAPVVLGRPYDAEGTLDSEGVLKADIIQRARKSKADWRPDR